MKIIDNFLPEHEFKRLESCIMSKHIPWYYNPGVDLLQFTHVMFEEKPSSDWFDIVHPIIDKIMVRMLFKVKVNLTTRTVFNRFTGYDVDWCDKTPDAYTSILYLNTNNGGTKFKGYDTIKSVANRFVTFNSSIEHGGITCTDQKRRVVLNFNYLL